MDIILGIFEWSFWLLMQLSVLYLYTTVLWRYWKDARKEWKRKR